MALLPEWVGETWKPIPDTGGCLLAIKDGKRNQRRGTHDDVDEPEGLVNICVRKLRVEKCVLQEVGVTGSLTISTSTVWDYQ